MKARGDALALPKIVVNHRRLRDLAEEAVQALEAANDPPTLFRRGDSLVRVALEDGPRARPLDPVGLKGELDRAADFVKVEGRLGKGEDGKAEAAVEERPARPPADLAPDLLARVDRLPFPTLRTLATSPVFVRGGRLVMDEGFDRGSGVYLTSGGLRGVRADVPVPEALALLRDELLGDFPFSPQDAGFAHTLSALLLPFVRPLIEGPTPLYLIEAPTRGSGKDLLAEAIACVALGHPAGVMVKPRDGDEFEKRVTSALLEGARVIVLGNVHVLEGEALAAALTARVWKGRLLGKSQRLTLPNDALWLATGNNVKLDDDMPRRIVPIRLDPGVERPEERTDFKHDPLIEWAAANRAALVSACLSLVSAWIAAGMPAGRKSLGSFESWARVTGGVLETAGVPGFLAAREHLYETANAEPRQWASVLEEVYNAHGPKPVGAKHFLAAMRVREALLHLWAEHKDLAACQRIGHALQGRRDRIHGGFVLRVAGTGETGNAAYRVERHAGRGTPKTPETPADRPGEPLGAQTDEEVFPGETPEKHLPSVAASGEAPPKHPPEHRGENDVRHAHSGVSGVSGVSLGPPREPGADVAEL